MNKVFDNNRLEFPISDEIRVDFEFRGKKQVINGESATGKSLIFKTLEQIISDNNAGADDVDATDIILIDKKDNDGTVADKLKRNHNKLIIIDRADILLDEEAVKIINCNMEGNTYLIFARGGLGLSLSPNYYAELINDNGVLKLKWEFSEKGWF